jgi:hypothetical protein
VNTEVIGAFGSDVTVITTMATGTVVMDAKDIGIAVTMETAIVPAKLMGIVEAINPTKSAARNAV